MYIFLFMSKEKKALALVRELLGLFEKDVHEARCCTDTSCMFVFMYVCREACSLWVMYVENLVFPQTCQLMCVRMCVCVYIYIYNRCMSVKMVAVTLYVQRCCFFPGTV